MMIEVLLSLIHISMYEYLKEEGKKEVDEIKWENVGYKVRGIYDEVIKNYGKQ